jgi:hypothetical protein
MSYLDTLVNLNPVSSTISIKPAPFRGSYKKSYGRRCLESLLLFYLKLVLVESFVARHIAPSTSLESTRCHRVRDG